MKNSENWWFGCSPPECSENGIDLGQATTLPGEQTRCSCLLTYPVSYLVSKSLTYTLHNLLSSYHTIKHLNQRLRELFLSLKSASLVLESKAERNWFADFSLIT
jgi:hypothetical protein